MKKFYNVKLLALAMCFTMFTNIAIGSASTIFVDTIQPYFSDYTAYFTNEADKKDFKRLRAYYDEKYAQIHAMRDQLEGMPNQDQSLINDLINDKASFDTRVTNIRLPEYVKAGQLNIISDQYKKLAYKSTTKTEIKEVFLPQINKALNLFNLNKYNANQLEKNIRLIKQDINNIELVINRTLAPANKDQEFKTNVSMYFAILIGVLLFGFFVIIYNRSDETLAKELLGNNGLQFIILFILIIAVILFGILGILKGGELAAILSGISGYILGKSAIVNNNTTIAVADDED